MMPCTNHKHTEKPAVTMWQRALLGNVPDKNSGLLLFDNFHHDSHIGKRGI